MEIKARKEPKFSGGPSLTLVQINDDFPDEQLLEIEDVKPMPWFTD